MSRLKSKQTLQRFSDVRPYLLGVGCVLISVVAIMVPNTGGKAQNPAIKSEPPTQVSIFFPGGSAFIVPQQEARLRAFVDRVLDIKNYGIELQGHTDDIGNREYNMRLSAKRVASVQQLLEALKVDPNAIELLPLGEEEPSYDNSTWEGKLSNRRVDVILKPML